MAVIRNSPVGGRQTALGCTSVVGGGAVTSELGSEGGGGVPRLGWPQCRGRAAKGPNTPGG